MSTSRVVRSHHTAIRSLSNCHAGDMDRLLCFSLLLTHLPVIDCTTHKSHCLQQPNRHIWGKIGQKAVLHCTVNSDCPTEGRHFEWFAFKENVHFRLNLGQEKYSLNGPSLHIKSLHGNDSGIYHCASVSSAGSGCCAHHVGPGQTLIVRDKHQPIVRHILLFLLLALLAVYSLAVLTLIILKKYGFSLKGWRKTERSHKKYSSKKKTQFRDVLQEMYRKRNLEKGKQAASGNHFQVEVVHSDLDSSAEGIYQNI